jgi:hypothetical protein
MATFRGRDGVVEVGANAVLKLQSWEYTETVGTIEGDAMGDTWMSRKSDLKDASGSIVFFEDDTSSANGQTALTLGAEVTLKLYSRGNSAGKVYRTGPAIVTEISHPVAKGDMVTITASWVGNGSWSTATVPAPGG